MNYWDVFEWLKETYMFSGEIPTVMETFERFSDLSKYQVFDGIREFETMMKQTVTLKA